MRRLVVVLADGLRPDAVSPGIMPSLHALGRAFTLAHHARTVRPSTTVPALASLATGVGPRTHRFLEPGLAFLSGLGALRRSRGSSRAPASLQRSSPPVSAGRPSPSPGRSRRRRESGC